MDRQRRELAVGVLCLFVIAAAGWGLNAARPILNPRPKPEEWPIPRSYYRDDEAWRDAKRHATQARENGSLGER
jgi:hypothetical protein